MFQAELVSLQIAGASLHRYFKSTLIFSVILKHFKCEGVPEYYKRAETQFGSCRPVDLMFWAFRLAVSDVTHYAGKYASINF